jgi:hypothetical protein
MSPIEPFCNCVVAARRVLRPFAGPRRGGLTDSTPEIGLLGAGLCGADASGAVAVCDVSRATSQRSHCRGELVGDE